MSANILVRNCEHCNRSFSVRAVLVRRGGGKFCSHPCSAAGRINKSLRSCLCCGKEFVTSAASLKRGWGRFCSKTCGARKGPRGPLALRFWSKVDKHGPVPAHVPHLGQCWIWTGARATGGYGAFKLSHRTGERAHRMSFFLEHGRWPEPQCLHRCDNPSCVRPAHLFEGTHQDNMADKVTKGRVRTGGHLVFGERSPWAKLSAADVLLIRAARDSGETYRSIAKRFGVAHSTVEDAVSRKTWRSV